MGFIKKNNANIFLFINAFLWGSSYVWSKMLLSFLPQFAILFICSLGSLAATITVFRKSLNGHMSLYGILSSIIVSSFSIISNLFFMLALQHTSSSNAAFIVQVSVILTPIIMAVIDKKPPESRIILSAFIALSGLFILTCDFKTFSLNIGDIFALGNALFFSLHLAGLKVISKKVDSIKFTTLHHGLNTLVFFALTIFAGTANVNLSNLKTPIFIFLAAASIFISAATILIQSTAMKFAQPEKASLIYTFEPLTALLLAFIFLGEKPAGIPVAIGCILILISVIYSLQKTQGNTDAANLHTTRIQRSRRPFAD
jgi:drug/metabolite transporter (DMT)-like permease